MKSVASHGWTKINVNAGCPRDSPFIVIVVLARDHFGNLKGSVTLVEDAKPTLEAEALAIWWLFCFAKHLKLTSVIVESDPLSVVSVLNGDLGHCRLSCETIS